MPACLPVYPAYIFDVVTKCTCRSRWPRALRRGSRAACLLELRVRKKKKSRLGHECLLCLWFRASLFYINNCPTRCNTKESIYYSASSLCMFRVSTTPFIMSTQNCKNSLRYWSQFFLQLPPSKVAKLTSDLQNNK